jgi:hypothetical protein
LPCAKFATLLMTPTNVPLASVPSAPPIAAGLHVTHLGEKIPTSQCALEGERYQVPMPFAQLPAPEAFFHLASVATTVLSWCPSNWLSCHRRRWQFRAGNRIHI